MYFARDALMQVVFLPTLQQVCSLLEKQLFLLMCLFDSTRCQAAYELPRENDIQQHNRQHCQCQRR